MTCPTTNAATCGVWASSSTSCCRANVRLRASVAATAVGIVAKNVPIVSSSCSSVSRTAFMTFPAPTGTASARTPKTSYVICSNTTLLWDIRRPMCWDIRGSRDRCPPLNCARLLFSRGNAHFSNASH